MQPILGRLGLGNPDEEPRRPVHGPVVDGGEELTGSVVYGAPESVGPEPSQRRRVGAVEGDVTEIDRHAPTIVELTVVRRRCNNWYIDGGGTDRHKPQTPAGEPPPQREGVRPHIGGISAPTVHRKPNVQR